MKPIWIIDDDQSIRWVLEKALQRHQLPVRTFGDVREVKEALTEDLPQVMVSDIRMPGGSSPNAGLELLHTVRREHPEVPVIIMTAYSDLESAVSAFQGGAFEYLPKPFDVDKAVELIDRALQETLRDEIRDAESVTETPANRDRAKNSLRVPCIGTAPGVMPLLSPSIQLPFHEICSKVNCLGMSVALLPVPRPCVEAGSSRLKAELCFSMR
jgi:DNA-binding NtrC family response regulator